MGREKDMEEKRYRIIGTAGHIDHGKTWLVKALTGTDTDRLAEEKRRGITIENGFAFLKFPDGREAGIIDVPGHERFIKNMLAGAGGIDIAMVVIAVDEGVMPQTREHLAILSLLGIRKGVLVLTKGDLEWKKGLDQEIREFAEGTFLENADVVVTSAVDGRGIEELRRVLWKLCTAGKTTENQNLSSVSSEGIVRVVRHIKTHYKKKIQLEEMAAMACLGISQFSVLFRRQTGQSPMAFLIGIRLKKAMEMIFSTDLKIYEIANACGFDSVSYFNRQFRAAYGVTPLSCRRK